MGIKSSGGVFRNKMICQDEKGRNAKKIQYKESGGWKLKEVNIFRI